MLLALRSLLPMLAALLLAGPVLAQTAPIPTNLDGKSSGSEQLPHQRPAIPEPLYLLNGRIISGGNSLASINPQDIAAIVVYHAGQVPAGWTTPAALNVLAIQLKPGVRLPSRPLSRLKRQLHVRGPVRYLLAGQPLPDANLRLAVGALDTAKVLPPAPGEAVTTIAIRLKQPQPRTYSPGTILIRGVARR